VIYKAGRGIQVDLLIFLTYAVCEDFGTVAFTVACQYEGGVGRPVAGRIVSQSPKFSDIKSFFEILSQCATKN